jgi:hypothetical protein
LGISGSDPGFEDVNILDNRGCLPYIGGPEIERKKSIRTTAHNNDNKSPVSLGS